MYLEHFGLSVNPFCLNSGSEFFFAGANRGEILDALIYSVSRVDGIILVSGETGSGKTMLCRMLIERLPKHVETLYLDNPSLSREEMLYAIAKALGLNIDGERVGITMQNIHNKLMQRARQGRRIVVLVDEAHVMPLNTLEELRLLYNLQFGSFKLLQIILFGQTELNDKLNQPNMRQLKDRIVHHFHLQPLSRTDLEGFLTFRMHAASYQSQNSFSPKAIKMMANFSQGLISQINNLAGKSLLAAFEEGTHTVETRHVQKARQNREIKSTSSHISVKKLITGGIAAALILIVFTAWWLRGQPPAFQQQNQAAQLAPTLSSPVPKSGYLAASQEIEASSASIATASLAPRPIKLRLDLNLALPKHSPK